MFGESVARPTRPRGDERFARNPFVGASGEWNPLQIASRQAQSRVVNDSVDFAIFRMVSAGAFRAKNLEFSGFLAFCLS